MMRSLLSSLFLQAALWVVTAAFDVGAGTAENPSFDLAGIRQVEIRGGEQDMNIVLAGGDGLRLVVDMQGMEREPAGGGKDVAALEVSSSVDGDRLILQVDAVR